MLWKTGKKEIIEFNKVLEILKRVSEDDKHKIIIGTDSVKLGHDFVFSNAICVVNTNKFYDRKYFYTRVKIRDDSFYDLSKRILKETVESINIALDIKSKIKKANIEIHADVNDSTNHISSKYKNMVVGYVSGCGFECKIKPNAFVASAIADVHTRKK